MVGPWAEPACLSSLFECDISFLLVLFPAGFFFSMCHFVCVCARVHAFAKKRNGAGAVFLEETTWCFWQFLFFSKDQGACVVATTRAWFFRGR